MDRLSVIYIKPSRIAVYLHHVAWLLSMIALWLCGLPVWLKLPLTVGLLCAAVWQHHQQTLLPLNAIGFEQEQWWALIRDHNMPMELIHDQLVLPWLMVLNLREKASGKKYALALWPDMADADDLRRLRVFLRYH